MTEEYISKQNAVDVFNRAVQDVGILDADDIETVFGMLLPAADVVLVVHAYWIPQKENYEFKEAWMKCSACGYPVSRWTGNTNFCPNCGAKMDAQREE